MASTWDLVTKQDFAGNGIMYTAGCSTFNSTVKIMVSDSAPIDAGRATPNDPSQYDLQGGLEHELGHAARGWEDCTDGTSDPQCEGDHFDTVHNAAICDSDNLQDWSTMCWKYPSKADSWKLRSLEDHDVDTMAAAY